MASVTSTGRQAGLRGRAWRAFAVIAAMVLGPMATAQAQSASPTPPGAAQQEVSSAPLFAASFKDFDRQLQPLAKYKGQIGRAHV